MFIWGSCTKQNATHKAPQNTAMRKLRGCRNVPQQQLVVLQQLRQIYFSDFETVLSIVRSVTGSSHDPSRKSRGCHNLRLRRMFHLSIGLPLDN